MKPRKAEIIAREKHLLLLCFGIYFFVMLFSDTDFFETYCITFRELIFDNLLPWIGLSAGTYIVTTSLLALIRYLKKKFKKTEKSAS